MIGLMKDEFDGKIMKENQDLDLKHKIYSYLTDDGCVARKQ